MSLKLRALGLGLLAILATSAFAVVNATAETGGHFVSEVSHTVLSGTEVKENHQVRFAVDGGTPIECTKVTYTGTTTATTVTEVTITPHYTECITKGGATPHNVDVTMNGCAYVFTIGKKSTADNTVHVECLTGGVIEIHHPNCTITVPAQTPSGGIAYETDTTPGGKHSITPNITVTGIAAQYHGGICIFLGTSHQATMTGAATLSGTTTEGSPVGITATGAQG